MKYIITTNHKLIAHNKTLKNKKIPKNKTLKKSTNFNYSSKMYDAESMVNEYKKKGETFLKKLNEDQLSYFIRLLNKYYYGNNKPLVDDEQYDILKEYIEEFYPNNEAVKEGHTKCTVAMEKNKVELPYTLWSMDKIKTESGVKNKLKKYKNDKDM